MWLASLKQRFIAAFKKRFMQFARSRRPKGRFITLNQKRIFIFPTLAGWMYLMMCVLLFLVGTNYQNNLIHAVAFLLISLGVLTIHYTFLNLSGLSLRAVAGYNCYQGEMAEFVVQLETQNRRYYQGIQLSWPEQSVETVSVKSSQIERVRLYHSTQQRGLLDPELLLVETVFPFGLLRAWSWVDLELSALVYPQPVKGRAPESFGGEGDGELEQQGSGDDFSGLEEYRPGVSPRHIAWKQYAQGRGLYSKTFVGKKDQHIWIDWEHWPELSTEKRLSVMCYWAKQFEHQRVEYGLRLAGYTLKPSSGPEHLEKLLSELALFQAKPMDKVV